MGDCGPLIASLGRSLCPGYFVGGNGRDSYGSHVEQSQHVNAKSSVFRDYLPPLVISAVLFIRVSLKLCLLLNRTIYNNYGSRLSLFLLR